jgi:dynactin-5
MSAEKWRGQKFERDFTVEISVALTVAPSVSLLCCLSFPDARAAFATTKRQNKVSKESVLCGSDNIGVKGKTIIEAQAVIRGDLGTIEFGSYCVIARGAVIRPAEQQFQGRVAYIPITIGDHVVIEENSVIEAAAIGDCTHIGKNCKIGPRCIISPCCEILDGSVLAANSVTPPFSIWSGIPAVQVGKLPESYQLVWQEHTRAFYRNFQPTPAPAASTVKPTPVDTSATFSSATKTPLQSPVRGSPMSPALPPGRHRNTASVAPPTPSAAATPAASPSTDENTPMPALPPVPGQ